MAIRKNTFLIKRSNIPGNIPTAGQILLGELALNTADVILYASGTTSNSILPIGWDRVSRTGDTMTGTLYAPSISATTITGVTISATTYLNLPIDIRVTGGTYNAGNIIFTNSTGGTFSVTGLTTNDTFVTGYTYSNNLLTIKQNQGQPDLSVLIDVMTGLTVNGNLTVTGTTTSNNLTSTTVSATTYQNLPTDVFTTGGTYTNGITTFTNNTGGTFNVTGFNTTINTFVTGGTPDNTNHLYTFTNNTGGTFNVTALTDIMVTGGTYNSSTGVVTYTNNTGGTFSISGLFTGSTEVFVTGFTYSNNTFSIFDNTGGTLTTLFNTVTGLTVNGNLIVTGNTLSNSLSATSITGTTGYFNNLNTNILSTITVSATTYFGLPTDIRVTGGTFNNNTDVITFTNNTGGTFTITGLTDNFTTGATLVGSIVYFDRNDSLSAYTLDLTSLDVNDTFVTGGTPNNAAKTYTFTNNSGGTFTVAGLTDISVTGGTYNSSTGVVTYTNNTGGTFSVNGLFTGSTEVFVTGGTYSSSAGTATYTNNTGGTFNVTGFLTGFTDTTISAFTYDNANKFTITDTSGGTFSLLANVMTGLTVNGALQATTISATTYLNLPTDIRVTGGTPNNAAKTYTFTNNTGGTFTVNGLTDITVTGGTLSAGTATFVNNTGGTFSITGFNTTIDTFVTGGTPNNAAKTYTFTNNTGGTFNVTALTDISVTGITNSNNLITLTNNTGGTFSTLFNTVTGLTVNGILSATTYAGLPTDIRVTGGTYSNGTAIFTNNTGGTFSVIGFSTAVTTTDVFTTGGTPNNAAKTYTFTNNTGGTFTVASLTDITVTGGTYSAGTTTFTNNTGGTFSITGFNTTIDTFVTGMTLTNGTLTLSRNQGLSALTASTNVIREISWGSSVMTLGTATRVLLSPLIMSVTRFPGTGAISDAGLSFTIPNKYLGNPQFYFTWYAQTTAATSAKTFIDIYTGSTAELAGGLTTVVETLSFVDVPNVINTFLYSPLATSGLVLSGGDSIHVRIYRNPADATDTYTDNLNMINFVFRYNSIG